MSFVRLARHAPDLTRDAAVVGCIRWLPNNPHYMQGFSGFAVGLGNSLVRNKYHLSNPSAAGLGK